eukprot:10661414-Ditylum_brightwellii.AAC.1
MNHFQQEIINNEGIKCNNNEVKFAAAKRPPNSSKVVKDMKISGYFGGERRKKNNFDKERARKRARTKKMRQDKHIGKIENETKVVPVSKRKRRYFLVAAGGGISDSSEDDSKDNNNSKEDCKAEVSDDEKKPEVEVKKK